MVYYLSWGKFFFLLNKKKLIKMPTTTTLVVVGRSQRRRLEGGEDLEKASEVIFLYIFMNSNENEFHVWIKQ